ncbi:hypothetical protein [Burkholderia sp. SG-MS1]|uniref:hypothetical protein n=1 Tax=Paraburkholderia sp. SG-MS1 TaxID=2023741 RepID=UPI00188563DE
MTVASGIGNVPNNSLAGAVTTRQQQFDFNCGVAALVTLLKFGYHSDIPETEPIRRMMVFSTPEVAVKNVSRCST